MSWGNRRDGRVIVEFTADELRQLVVLVASRDATPYLSPEVQSVIRKAKTVVDAGPSTVLRFLVES